MKPEEVEKIWDRANDLNTGNQGDPDGEVMRLCVEYAKEYINACYEAGASEVARPWEFLLKKISPSGGENGI